MWFFLMMWNYVDMGGLLWEKVGLNFGDIEDFESIFFE